MNRTGSLHRITTLALTAVLFAAALQATGCSCSPRSKDGRDLGNLIKSYVSSKTNDNGDSNNAVSGMADSWIEHAPTEKTARNQVIDTFFEAAETGDKDMMAGCFAREIREGADFDRKVDEFMKAYPKGLESCKEDFIPGSAGGSYNGSNVIKNAGTRCKTYLDGEWYDIEFRFCLENTQDPDKVGLVSASVMDKEARACFIDEDNRNFGELEPDYLVCDIRDDSTAEVRIINDSPFFWTQTDTPKLTEDEMRTLLTSCRNLAVAEDTIGQPNATFKSFNSTGYYHYYELKSEDGKPKYACICADSQMGTIIDAYTATDMKDSKDFDNPLCPYIKPQG